MTTTGGDGRSWKRRPHLWARRGTALLSALLSVAVILSGCGAAHHVSTSDATSVGTGDADQTGSLTAPADLGLSGNWHLVLNAGFGGTSIDSRLWRAGWFGTGVSGPINTTEVACYRSANAALTGSGDLGLSVTDDHSTCNGRTREFTGAMLSSDPHDGRRSGGFQYRYGFLQARVYLPANPLGKIANWPGVLTLGQHWPRDGEDDVVEGLNGALCSYFRSDGHARNNAPGKCSPSYKPGWHTFSVNWEPGSATWYYDGHEIDRIDRGISSSPMYIVLVNSVWLQAELNSQPGTMKVAYVRVWQRS